MKTLSCHVKSVTPFNQAVFQVILSPEESIDFKAGQYLSVIMDENDKRPFSIASAPNATELELHIGAAVAESYPMQVVERLKSCLLNKTQIQVEIPAGNAFIRESSPRPRLLIAGGTGFSYIKSIIEHQIHVQDHQATTLYWGCRNEGAIYDLAIAQEWARQYDWLTFIPVVEESHSTWSGKTANLLVQVDHDFQDVSDYDIYVAGRFDMAAAARDMLRTKNVNEDHLYGDAFAFIK